MGTTNINITLHIVSMVYKARTTQRTTASQPSTILV